MFAARNAGASLTPSPVIPTISPSLCKARTILNLCSGTTRAKTEMCGMSALSSSSDELSISGPVTQRSGFGSPISFAIAIAVLGWSPVIMMVRIPAVAQLWIDSMTPSRRGS